jgi:apolipoprotein N-acyltransferase
LLLHPSARYIGALLLGAASVAAWAPLAWWPLALVAYGLLFLWVDSHPTSWVAAYFGLLFGIGFHLTGHG